MYVNRSLIALFALALVLVLLFLALVLLNVWGPAPTLTGTDSSREVSVQVVPAALMAVVPTLTPTITPTPTATPTPTVTPTPLTYDAEQVVLKMYDALTNDDRFAYLDTIPLRSRQAIKLENVIRGVIVSAHFEAYGLVVPFKELLWVSYRDVRVVSIWISDGYVITKAEGLVSMPKLGSEYKMCDIWDVRREDGRWFVDIDAKEREQRLMAVVAKRRQDDPNLANLPTAVGDFIAHWGKGLDKLLSMCE